MTCKCSHEAGDSDCHVHPDCPNCGYSLESTDLAREHDKACATVIRLTALVEAWRPVVRAAIDDDAESGSLMPVDRRRVPMCVALDALPEEHKP